MRKSYSTFTIEQIKDDFGVEIVSIFGEYEKTKEFEVNEFITRQVLDNLPLALAIGTEKAKSEFLVAPMLGELRRLTNNQISLFSGVEFNVDAKQGLKGVCDFLLSDSPHQYYIDAPIVTLVEAKDDDLKDGLPQCLAEMVAAQIFNERKNIPPKTIYGIVTTGSLWNFIHLENKNAFVDSKEYSIENPHKIMGILLSMVGKNL
jgi:hypothetical protein